MSVATEVPVLPGSADEHVFAAGSIREVLENEILPGYIARCRWFGAKARRLKRFRLTDLIPLGTTSGAARLAFVEIEYEEGTSDTYLLPLQIATGDDAAALSRTEPGSVVAAFADGSLLADAIHLPSFRSALFALMAGSGSFSGEHGRIAGSPGPILGVHRTPPSSRALSVEQSNSSIIYGDHVFLKLYRRLEEGLNPDAEILHFLGEQNFPHVPPFGGSIEYHGLDGGVRVLALALGLVANDGDAWSFTLRQLEEYYRALIADDRAGAETVLTGYLASAAQLGSRSGELHVALAGDSALPGFAHEPLSAGDGTSLCTALRLAIQQVRTLLAENHQMLDAQTQALVGRLLDAESSFLARADAISNAAISAAKTRTHGDYHLGQVLHGPNGFVIIDFEGEPLRSLAERRQKMSPFRDVAGMLRSFHYATYAALEPLGDARSRLASDAETWVARVQQAFLDAWLSTTRDAVFRDPDPANEKALLDAFLLEKALYEIRYEVNNRPGWVGIPLRGVLRLVEQGS
jgi:maltose alpha-D-glucosyltransferase/alpha-amylase